MGWLGFSGISLQKQCHDVWVTLCEMGVLV